MLDLLALSIVLLVFLGVCQQIILWNRGRCLCGNFWKLTEDECMTRTYQCENCKEIIRITFPID